MAIPLKDQFTQAVKQLDTRGRIAAALMSQAITSTTAPVNPTQATQDHRLEFASQIIADVERHLDPVAWFVVTRPSLNTVDDLNVDANITAILTQQAFDLIALQLVEIPAP